MSSSPSSLNQSLSKPLLNMLPKLKKVALFGRDESAKLSSIPAKYSDDPSYDTSEPCLGDKAQIRLHMEARNSLDEICTKRLFPFSPVPNSLLSVYTDTRWNGTLDFPSEYRGDPNPSVDAAWSRLDDIKVMSVTKDDVLKSGSDLDSVKVPEEYGGGYLASLEVTHQLHCLATYWDYYQFRSVEFSDEPAMVRTHLDHCVEILRQNLMCKADGAVILHRWVENNPNPYPNFNVVHKCRNFEQIQGWAREQSVPTPPGYAFVRQPGEKLFSAPP
ncbi:hypothetical protein PWT90_07875 [Aphanocladium album]|nr:hypothetical protein PWT90_07875 [Aphanocladium album]